MKDDFLITFINIVNEIKELSIDVTLNVKGTMISGSLISSDSYLKEVSNGFKNANGNATIGQVFSENLDRLAEEVATSPSNVEEKSDTKKAETNFIHLKNAKIVHLNGNFITNSVWRGKVESVDGFFLGSFNRD